MKEKIAVVSILVNIVLAGGKIAAGLITGLSSVLADGIHSFVDVFSSVVGFIGIKIGQKPADKEHPFGHYKFEVLAGFFITLILASTGLGIIYNAYQKILNPSTAKFPLIVFAIMFFSAAVNEVMARLKIYYGKKENSVVLLSDGIHSRVDVLTSLVIFFGLFLVRFWVYIDAFLAFLIGVYIIKESFSLGKEAIDSLLDVSAGEEVEEKIRQIAKKEGIEIDSLKTQKKGSVITVNLEIILPKNLTVDEATKISNNLREKLMKEIKSLSYVGIQIISHELETGFYKPDFFGGFGWQRRGQKESASQKSLVDWCVCPKCGYKIVHQKGVPCSTIACPNCQLNLRRKMG